MDLSLILFGVHAVLRLGGVGKEALDQWARDDTVIFPALQNARFDREVFVNGFYNLKENEGFVKGEAAPYGAYWRNDAVLPEKTAIDALFTAAVKIRSDKGFDHDRGLLTGAATLVSQWDPSRGPLSPWARIILTAGDIALEYVSGNPSVFGVSGKGQNLIAAYAKNLSELLPNDGTFGTQENFAQRLCATFLRAGFETLSQNPHWIVSQKPLQALMTAVVKPIVNAFPKSIVDQLRWRDAAEAVMGPAARAAMQILAEKPAAYFGNDLETNKALGALTQALLRQAAAVGLAETFTTEGLISLYKAALAVIAERPTLITGDGRRPQDAFAGDLLSRFSEVLLHMSPPFDGEVGVALACAALEAVGANVRIFAQGNGHWEDTAARIVMSFTKTLKEVFEENRDLMCLFSRPQLIELGRILMERLSEAPEMVLGSNTRSWGGVLTAVATAMKADTSLLLNGDDWLEIAKVAAEEAAANPGRLFALNPDDPADLLAAKLLGTVLKAAGAVSEFPGLKSRTVLFGKTLREAIIILLHVTSGNPEGARAHLDLIASLVKDLNLWVGNNSDRFGNREWLGLFRLLLTGLLDEQNIPELNPDTAKKLLRGGAH